MRAAIVGMLLACASTASAQTLVTVQLGKDGELDETRLYVIDYSCGFEEPLLKSLTDSLYGFGVYSDITVNFGAKLKSRNAAANATTAEGALVFTTNVVTHRRKIFNRPDTRPGACTGQFFISGKERYALEPSAGYTETSTLGDLAARLATLVISGASAIYPLVRLTKPAEFDERVNQARDALKTFSDFQALFRVTRTDQVGQPEDIRVGTNVVTARDSGGKRVAWLVLQVTPVVSLVQSQHTSFLSAYQAAAADSAIDLTGGDEELRQRCSKIKQSYGLSGIQDTSDMAYLLYRRLLVGGASPEKTVKCMGDRPIALAALELLNLKKSPIPAIREYRISLNDIETYLPALPDSNQPHTRPHLASEIDSLVDGLSRHLRGQGLLGRDLAHLKGAFSDPVTVEDRTTDYKALTSITGTRTDSTSFTPNDLLAKLRSGGILRWRCVQRTKRDKPAASVWIYDRDVDSAVMIIAAKVGASEELDFNKSTLFGVHLLFASADPTKPLQISKLVFEERYRDAILKENPTCVKNTPTK
jgi:hypothetical protein